MSHFTSKAPDECSEGADTRRLISLISIEARGNCLRITREENLVRGGICPGGSMGVLAPTLSTRRLIGVLLMTAMTMVCDIATVSQEKSIPPDRKTLSEFVGAYQWTDDHFIYIQFWDELKTSKAFLIA